MPWLVAPWVTLSPLHLLIRAFVVGFKAHPVQTVLKTLSHNIRRLFVSTKPCLRTLMNIALVGGWDSPHRRDGANGNSQP